MEYYVQLLQGLLEVTRGLTPRPDAVVGIQRSGLFPAVFLSQQLDLPMLVGSEVKSFPFPRLALPLVVDTVAWSGGTVRRVARKLERAGVVEVRTLVMFARADPFPEVPGLLYLRKAGGIPRFWYDEPLPTQGES